ncbi:hypothetical protein [Nocardia niigatensis]|uniref:hypothetical protein n=1 Tax=Nocardia niigatensis TaxID=209249 RepID=UPI00030A3271|nr:hypothetical protein [Nocardia niigatensis]
MRLRATHSKAQRTLKGRNASRKAEIARASQERFLGRPGRLDRAVYAGHSLADPAYY